MFKRLSKIIAALGAAGILALPSMANASCYEWGLAGSAPPDIGVCSCGNSTGQAWLEGPDGHSSYQHGYYGFTRRYSETRIRGYVVCATSRTTTSRASYQAPWWSTTWGFVACSSTHPYAVYVRCIIG